MVSSLDIVEFSAICRTCLSKENLLPIFPNISKQTGQQLSDLFFNITGLKVETDDGLPQNICRKCTDIINDTHNFRTTCKEAENTLIKIKDGMKDVIKNETILLNPTSNIENKEISKSTEIKECVKIDKKYKLKKDIEKESKDNFNFDNTGKESKLYVFDVTDSNEKRVICMLCQKRLLIKSFWTHMSRSHPGINERQVKCELCDNYIMKEKMNRHKKLMHGNSFKCRYCKSNFEGRDLLVEHVVSCPKKKTRKEYETSREMVECEVCNKTMQKGSLRVHKAIKHAGLGPVCDHCGKRFGNKLRLQEHYRAKHGYKKFKCSECDFQSASIIALKNHERRHRGEKPFVCETCGADFHAAYLLVQHRHSHRTDKRFKCDKCPASFKARNSLHTHTRACHTQTRVVCVRALTVAATTRSNTCALCTGTRGLCRLCTHTQHKMLTIINKLC